MLGVRVSSTAPFFKGDSLSINCVYFISSRKKNSPIKIGKSTNLKSRLSSISVGHPEKLNFMGIIVDQNDKLEERLHEEFSEYRLQGEWFSRNEKIISYIEKNCISYEKACKIVDKMSGDKVETIFRENLNKYLKGRNLSRVARELDISKSILFDWTKGRRVPSFKNLYQVKKIADYIGLSFEDILIGEKSNVDLIKSVDFLENDKRYIIKVERV